LETVRLSNGSNELTLRLRPDHLGSLHLTISTHADRVTARVVAETTQAQQAMESAKDQLRDALAHRGLRLETLHVSVEQGPVSDGRSGFTGQGQTPQELAEQGALRFAGRPSRNAGIAETPIAPIETPGVLQRRDPTSRLDYRA